MQVKIFEAPDMTTGLKRIREEFGPDALILSTRTRREGPLGLLGKPVVEITAAIDGLPASGNAVTMAERNILTGGGQITRDMPASRPARAQVNPSVPRKRIDCTVGANDDLLADLRPPGKSALRAAKASPPSPAKSRKQSPRQDVPKQTTPPESQQADADARQQILAALAGSGVENALTNRRRKPQETAPAGPPPAPKAKPSVKKRGAAAATAAAKRTARQDSGQATDKKNARRQTNKQTVAKDAGAAQDGVPKRKRASAKASRQKSTDFLTASLSKIGEQPTAPPPKLLSYLKDRGIEPEAARALACHAERLLPPSQLGNPQAVRRCLVEAVQNFISVAPPDFTGGGKQRRIALVGPTGVGKTTTIAKLAAWYLARQYGKLALITIDTYRIAAVEQLKVYGEIMRLPVEVVMDPKQLTVCLKKHHDAALILIDTSGHSPQNGQMVAELGDFFTACPPIEKHLVLSATTRENELLHSLKAFQPLDVERTIFTKIDECLNLGVLLNVQLHNAQPLSFLTNGQRVPEDLLEIDRRLVAELILSEGAARHV